MFLKNAVQFFKQKASIFMIAFMLGISNVILEETRMVHDTKPKIEHQDIQSEETE